MKDLNLKKYDRIFISGCSFTHYKWPTWADIISEEVGHEKVFNYGFGAAGNFYITHSIIECDIIHKFTERDLVMVMFSNIHREDRYIHQSWNLSGNIYSQGVYDKGFLKYWDEDHAYMRDLMLIRMFRSFLKIKKVDYHLMSMVNLGIDMNGRDLMNQYQKKLISMYQEDLDDIHPSIHEVIFNFDWKSITPRSITPNPDATHHIYGDGWYEDNHAHPLEHLAYLQKLWPDTKFKQSTLDYAAYWHQRVLDKKDPYAEHLIKRKSNQRIDGSFFN